MTPFQTFRLWARRAPAGERAGATLAAAVVLAVLGWVIVPGGGSGSSADAGGSFATSSTGATTGAGGGAAASAQSGGGSASGGVVAGGGSPGAPAAAGSNGMSGVATGQQASGGAVTSGSGGTTGGGSAPQSGVGSGGCVSPPGSDKGVTGSQIKIGITVSNIVGPAGNQTFGIPTADEQKADYKAVIDDLNAHGGVACRQLAPTFYEVNPADQGQLQQTCLDIASAGMFADLDPSAYAGYPQKDCYPQHHIPYFTSYFLPEHETGTYYPYMFAFDTVDSLYHNTVFGLRDRGFFQASSGFKKLGFVYHDCFPEIVKKTQTWLNQAGVSSGQIVGFDVGCPAAFSSPSDLEQAVLKFQQSGVTHVLPGPEFEGDFANFTNIAEQQHYRPKYGIADEAVISVSYGSSHPNYANLANALIVTASSFGEERTPGMRPNAATKRCDAIYAAHGRPITYKDASGFAGYICNEVWMFAAAVDHAPALRHDALAAGLQRAHSVQMSFPQGPNDFSGNRVTVAGQFWRVAQFMTSCNCWQVVDRTFHPSVR